MPQTALRALLEGIIDYAGLFPPAALDLQQTVGNFQEYRRSDQSWMLGRVVIPAGRLEQLPAVLPDAAGRPAEISVLLPGIEQDGAAFHAAAWQLGRFVRAPVPGWRVAAVESRAESAQTLTHAAGQLPAGLDVFWELPHEREDLAALLEAVAGLGETGDAGGRHCAKIRTGGITAAQIPPVDQVARFILACASAGVAFKATAGLHHPVRAVQNLTYAADSPRAVMHGFLNVFCAAGLAWRGVRDSSPIEAVLAETSSRQFRIGEECVEAGTWRLSLADIRAMRSGFALSFGSCSFCEPVDDLLRMDWPLAGQPASGA